MTGDVIAELNDFVREDLMEALPPEAVAQIVDQLETDDAVQLIEDLDEAAVLRAAAAARTGSGGHEQADFARWPGFLGQDRLQGGAQRHHGRDVRRRHRGAGPRRGRSPGTAPACHGNASQGRGGSGRPGGSRGRCPTRSMSARPDRFRSAGGGGRRTR